MSDDKDLPPSETKLEKARDENQDESSQEISGLVTTLFVGALAYVTVPGLVEELKPLFSLESFDWRRIDDVHAIVNQAFGTLLNLSVRGAAMLVGVTFMSGMVGNVMNRRRPPSLKMPEISYDPISKAAGMFKPSGLITALKLWVLAMLIMGLAALEVRAALPMSVSAAQAGEGEAMAVAWKTGIAILPIAFGFAVLSAIVDGIQKHMEFIKNNMMDQEEVKKENKEENGDPEIKAKRMEIMRGG